MYYVAISFVQMNCVGVNSGSVEFCRIPDLEQLLNCALPAWQDQIWAGLPADEVVVHSILVFWEFLKAS